MSDENTKATETPDSAASALSAGLGVFMRYYSPVGKGTTLLKAQGSISYVQTDKETYDMEQHWIDRLAAQYGARQAAALRGDSVGTKAAEFWLGQIASEHWHEIIAALRGAETPNAN